MTTCETVARSHAYLTCSSSMLHLLFCRLFSGNGRTDGGSGTWQPNWSLPSIRSTKARPWSLLHSRLGARWSDVDVMKSLKAGTGTWGLLQGTEVLLHDGDDTRSSPHLSVVALGCLDVRDKRGEG